MIPRYQAFLIVLLLAASAVMGGVLWHLRDRAHQRLLAGEDSSPTQAPQVSPVQQATLLVANDSDDSLQTRILSLPLPPSPNERARAILARLMDLYAQPKATHPAPGGGAAIVQVFLMPAASAIIPQPPKPNSRTEPESQSGPQLAVVNLSSSFAAAHPSGIETETLTLMSICATLHANLPRISEVRFLVDGQPRATLAGHADLSRTYLTAELTSALPPARSGDSAGQ